MMKRLVRGQVVAGLLDAARDYELQLGEPGANAIFEELEMSEIMTLKNSTSEDEKLAILRGATLKAIAKAKDAGVKAELERLVADVEAKDNGGG